MKFSNYPPWERKTTCALKHLPDKQLFLQPWPEMESGYAQEGTHPQILLSMQGEWTLHPNLPSEEAPYSHDTATWKVIPNTSGWRREGQGS